MDEAPRLALTFLEERPESAARSLEVLDPADAAALLEAVPVRIAAPAVARMTSWTAARCIARVTPDRASAIVAELRTRDATAILRQLGSAERELLLDSLPAGVARHFRRTLTYPRMRAGAWVDHDVAVIDSAQTAGAALDLLAARRRSDDSVVFLIDASRTYVGVVPVGALLHAPRQAPLFTIADRHTRPVFASASLATALAHGGWTSYLVLPVTYPQGELLGAVNRATLEKGAQDARLTQPDRWEPSILVDIIEAYVVVVAGLARATPTLDAGGSPQRAGRSAS